MKNLVIYFLPDVFIIDLVGKKQNFCLYQDNSTSIDEKF